jgi:hypothetical protein
VSFFDQPLRVTRFKLVHAIVEVDAGLVLDAAAAAAALWSDDPYCSAD